MNRAVFSVLAAVLWLSSSPEAFAQAERCSVAPTSKLVVNARKYGAKGDGRTDDTVALQKAIDAVGGTGGTLFVPDGVYRINPIKKTQLRLKSRMTIKLAPGAVLQAIPNDQPHYAVLAIRGGSDINIVGGTLVGERSKHKERKGQWGMGVRIDRGAQRITVRDVTAKEMWGDGFYVDEAKDVAFCNVVADHNRRQGLSIIDADRVLVTGSVFKNTEGTRPMAGIDLEPDKRKQRIKNVRIERSKFLNNRGGGILIQAKKGSPNVYKVEILNNYFDDKPPIKIKYAPRVLDSEICNNRYVVPREASNSPGIVAGPPMNMTVTAPCGDLGIRVRTK